MESCARCPPSPTGIQRWKEREEAGQSVSRNHGEARSELVWSGSLKWLSYHTQKQCGFTARGTIPSLLSVLTRSAHFGDCYPNSFVPEVKRAPG